MPLNVEAKLANETWNDSLLDKDSIMFKTLESKIKNNVSLLFDLGNSTISARVHVFQKKKTADCLLVDMRITTYH